MATYGVPVIDISGLLGPGTQALTVELDDAGGDLGAATLHLVTNCSLAGAVPGGTITGNPINQNNPSSQTQTFTFDNGGGQNIGFTTSTSTAQQSGTVTIPTNTVPIFTDIGIPQQLFSQLVAGTSAGPAVCLRLTGEIDAIRPAMCKGYLIQCQDPTTKTISGANCVPNPARRETCWTSRDLSRPMRRSTERTSSAFGVHVPRPAYELRPDHTGWSQSGADRPRHADGQRQLAVRSGSDLTNCTNQELTVANPTGGSYPQRTAS